MLGLAVVMVEFQPAVISGIAAVLVAEASLLVDPVVAFAPATIDVWADDVVLDCSLSDPESDSESPPWAYDGKSWLAEVVGAAAEETIDELAEFCCAVLVAVAADDTELDSPASESCGSASAPFA